MTNQIAIIDPFVKSPAINCFNNLVNLLEIRATYHVPALLGLDSLISESLNTQAYIVLGSASHVHENLIWHRPLADFLMSELAKNKPLLGCCFGHQLICHAFGAKVDYYKDEATKLSGGREITVTEDFWNFTKGEKFYLGVTHKQVVNDLPECLSEVGVGLSNDIVIHKTLPFMGTQAHPEASLSFCQTDIKDLKNEEISKLQKSGEKLIKKFFHHFDLI